MLPLLFIKAALKWHRWAFRIKFQSVVTPDGLFACFFGPMSGNRHHLYMLARLELIPKPQAFMPSAGSETVYTLYGDPACPQSLYVVGGYRNPPPDSHRALRNTEMSKVCKVVEWGFANLVSNWAFIDFKASMMIFQNPFVKYFIVAAFLCNLRTCFYGNQVLDNFDCDALTIDDDSLLIDHD